MSGDMYDWARCDHEGIGMIGCSVCDPDKGRVAIRQSRVDNRALRSEVARLQTALAMSECNDERRDLKAEVERLTTEAAKEKQSHEATKQMLETFGEGLKRDAEAIEWHQKNARELQADVERLTTEAASREAEYSTALEWTQGELAALVAECDAKAEEVREACALKLDDLPTITDEHPELAVGLEDAKRYVRATPLGATPLAERIAALEHDKKTAYGVADDAARDLTTAQERIKELEAYRDGREAYWREREQQLIAQCDLSDRSIAFHADALATEKAAHAAEAQWSAGTISMGELMKAREAALMAVAERAWTASRRDDLRDWVELSEREQASIVKGEKP